MKKKSVWQDVCIAVLVAVAVMLVADSAYAQLEGVVEKVNSIRDTAISISSTATTS